MGIVEDSLSSTANLHIKTCHTGFGRTDWFQGCFEEKWKEMTNDCMSPRFFFSQEKLFLFQFCHISDLILCGRHNTDIQATTKWKKNRIFSKQLTSITDQQYRKLKNNKSKRGQFDDAMECFYSIISRILDNVYSFMLSLQANMSISIDTCHSGWKVQQQRHNKILGEKQFNSSGGVTLSSLEATTSSSLKLVQPD